MESNKPFCIGINLVSITSHGVLLRKTKKAKVYHVAKGAFFFVSLGFAIFTFIKGNQDYHVPAYIDWQGYLAIASLVIALLYSVFAFVRSIINDIKPYLITKNEGCVAVNGKPFAAESATELAIQRKLGWRALNEWYEVQLRRKRKSPFLRKKTIAYDKGLEEAKEIASLMSESLGLPIKTIDAG